MYFVAFVLYLIEKKVLSNNVDQDHIMWGLMWVCSVYIILWVPFGTIHSLNRLPYQI